MSGFGAMASDNTNPLTSRMMLHSQPFHFSRSNGGDHTAPLKPVTAGFAMDGGDKIFPGSHRDARFGPDLGRGMYGSQNPNWNPRLDRRSPSTDGSDGDDEDVDDDDGDGGSVQSSSEKAHGLSNKEQLEHAITVVEPELYCTQMLHREDGSASSAQKEIGGENEYGFFGRKEVGLLVDPVESLRTHLVDPITGLLMNDAMILPCGHSFGSGGMQHVLRVCCQWCTEARAIGAWRTDAPRYATRRSTLQRRAPLRSKLCHGAWRKKSCCRCSRPISEESVRPNLALRSAVQAFQREEESQSLRASRRRDRFEQEKCSYDDPYLMESRGKGVQFPFVVSDRVIIKGNKRTPQRFVGRVAVVTTQCLNGWYVVKTLDNAESVKLQYRSLAKFPDDQSSNMNHAKSTSATPNWL